MNMTDKETMKQLITDYVSGGNSITVPVSFVKLLRDYNTAAALVKLLDWANQRSEPGGIITVTYQDWTDETFLSEYQVRRATNELTLLGLLKEKRTVHGDGTTSLTYRLALTDRANRLTDLTAYVLDRFTVPGESRVYDLLADCEKKGVTARDMDFEARVASDWFDFVGGLKHLVDVADGKKNCN